LVPHGSVTGTEAGGSKEGRSDEFAGVAHRFLEWKATREPSGARAGKRTAGAVAVAGQVPVGAADAVLLAGADQNMLGGRVVGIAALGGIGDGGPRDGRAGG